MSRVQLALNVADLDASIEFYTKLFGTEPAKVSSSARLSSTWETSRPSGP